MFTLVERMDCPDALLVSCAYFRFPFETLPSSGSLFEAPNIAAFSQTFTPQPSYYQSILISMPSQVVVFNLVFHSHFKLLPWAGQGSAMAMIDSFGSFGRGPKLPNRRRHFQIRMQRRTDLSTHVGTCHFSTTSLQSLERVASGGHLRWTIPSFRTLISP